MNKLLQKPWNMLMTDTQHAKLKELGGARWIRQQIDRAHLHPGLTLPDSRLERNNMIATDIRTTKVVAKHWGLSTSTVENIRYQAKLHGRPYSIKNYRGKQ